MAAFDEEVLNRCSEIVTMILLNPALSKQDQFGIVCLATTHFLGTGAAIMKHVAKEKNGPDKTMEEWTIAMVETIKNLSLKKIMQ